MNKKLLLVLAVASGCFALPTKHFLQNDSINTGFIKHMSSLVKGTLLPPNNEVPLSQIRDFLYGQQGSLGAAVVSKVLASVECARENHIGVNNILTVIDYSLPSNQKRLWVFDLKNKDMLFHTYVSHGLTSGSLQTEFFSNKANSKASSIGVFKTEKSYYGREGLSLRLQGLDKGFNDNAHNRYIVMHGGWYMDEFFIKKYGRPGRSWGCPAMPDDLSGSIINTIKENSLLVIYYPDENWLASSKFLHCNQFSMMQQVHNAPQKPAQLLPDVQREPILYLDLNNNNKREENEPLLVTTADNYQRLFNLPPPLTRMLRRQIDKVEYIALTEAEFQRILLNGNMDPAKNSVFSDLYFIVPFLKVNRGHYETQMKIVPLGNIKNARQETHNLDTKFVLDFEKKSAVNLKSTGQFIRWLGL